VSAALRSTARRGGIPLLCVVMTVVIATLDWLTPAGVVVGILLSVPIIVTSMSDGSTQVWAISALAHVSFVVAAALGRGPISPAQVWVPNRVFTLLTLAASTGLSLLLQRHRLAAERSRDHALHARDVNRLLMSLLAHDLRTPLVLAVQGLDYVGTAGDPERPLDQELLRDLRLRLGRSLRAVEVVLSAARRDMDRPGDAALAVTEAIRGEAASFAEEAEALGKPLRLELEPGLERAQRVNRLVLRQTLAILLDNALRYSAPAPITVAAQLDGTRLALRVSDRGPGFEASRLAGSRAEPSSGLGLELARSLLHFAGGALVVERDCPEGSTLAAFLPLDGEAETAPELPPGRSL